MSIPISTPIFSVIVLNWNGRHLLTDCLSSLRQQSFQNFETILVDNGSTDDSVEFVEKEFPEIRLVKLNLNLGYAAGNNRGVHEARGKYIFFLNNDTEVDPFMFEELYKMTLQDPPEVGSWAVKMLNWDNRNMIDNLGCGYSAFGTGYQIDAGNLDTKTSTELDWVFGTSGGAGCYRRSVLDEIGLFDEDFFYNNEDVDLSFRAQLSGYRSHYVPRAKVYHRGSATGGATSDKTIYHIQRNKEWVFFKNMPLPLLLKYLPFHFIYSLAWIVYWIIKGKAKPVIRAKWDALCEWQIISKKRRRIQMIRKVDLHYLDKMIDKRRIFQIWRSHTLASFFKQNDYHHHNGYNN